MQLTASPLRIARRAGVVISWFLIVFVGILISATAVVPLVRGYVPITITSSSMSPTLEPGTLIFVEPVKDGHEVDLGSIVTYMPEAGNDGLLYTHRLIGKTTTSGGAPMIQTRGDANPVADAVLPAAAVRAQIVELQVGSFSMPYAVPKIGAAYLWLTSVKSSSGIQQWLPAIGVGVMLAGGIYLAAGFLPKRKRLDGVEITAIRYDADGVARDLGTDESDAADNRIEETKTH